VSDPWASVKIRQFEHFVAGPSMTLLRIDGKAPRRRSTDGPRPTLLADDGWKVHRFSALPSPPDARGILRAAYSVPAATITPDTVFSLECDDGAIIPLPPPTTAARGLAPPSKPAPDAARTEPAAEAPVTEVAEVAWPMEAEGAGVDAEDVEPDGPFAEPSPEIVLPEPDHPTAVYPVVEDEAGIAQLQARVRELEGRLDEAADARSAAEARAEQAERDTREQQERVTGLEQELAGTSGSRADLVRELASLRAAQADHEHDLQQARDAVNAITTERDELSRQAAAFDAVAVKARERATIAESAAGASAATLDELETWRAELERRLADTTTELEAARSNQTDDVRELRRIRGELAAAAPKTELAQADAVNLTRQLEDGAAEHEAAVAAHTAERDQLSAGRDQLSAESDQLRAERDEAVGAAEAAARAIVAAAETERDEIAGRALELEVERDRLTATVDELRSDMTRLSAELAEVQAQRDQVTEEAASAHDQLTERFGQVEAERDQLTERFGQLEAERDQLARHAERAESERDELARRIEDLGLSGDVAARQAEQIGALIGPAQQMAELARDFSDALARIETLQVTTGSRPSSEELDSISAEAEAEAREQAEQELLAALAESPADDR
jgi:chromosome segregation ATPase